MSSCQFDLMCASSALSSPTTDSAAPYIGEESTTRPPASENVRRTSRSGARAPGSPRTSKVCQVPMPMAGSSSPETGMRLAMMRDCGKAGVTAAAATAARSAPETRTTATRRITVLSSQFAGRRRSSLGGPPHQSRPLNPDRRTRGCSGPSLPRTQRHSTNSCPRQSADPTGRFANRPRTSRTTVVQAADTPIR